LCPVGPSAPRVARTRSMKWATSDTESQTVHRRDGAVLGTSFERRHDSPQAIRDRQRRSVHCCDSEAAAVTISMNRGRRWAPALGARQLSVSQNRRDGLDAAAKGTLPSNGPLRTPCAECPDRTGTTWVDGLRGTPAERSCATTDRSRRMPPASTMCAAAGTQVGDRAATSGHGSPAVLSIVLNVARPLKRPGARRADRTLGWPSRRRPAIDCGGRCCRHVDGSVFGPLVVGVE
jgi:hypothetical protein